MTTCVVQALSLAAAYLVLLPLAALLALHGAASLHQAATRRSPGLRAGHAGVGAFWLLTAAAIVAAPIVSSGRPALAGAALALAALVALTRR